MSAGQAKKEYSGTSEEPFGHLSFFVNAGRHQWAAYKERFGLARTLEEPQPPQAQA